MKKRNFFFCLGGFLSAAMSLLILIGLVWTPYGTTQMDASAKTQPPSWHHLMGTDNFGRDISSRVLGGAGTSFLVALAVVAIGCVFGLLIGGLCGYYGGVADAILTRLCDTLTAFPSVLLALVILFVAGHLWYALVEMVKDAIARRFFSGKREPWHPLPPDEGDSGDGPPGTV